MIGYGERQSPIMIHLPAAMKIHPWRRCFGDGKDPKMRSVSWILSLARSRTPVSSVRYSSYLSHNLITSLVVTW